MHRARGIERAFAAGTTSCATTGVSDGHGAQFKPYTVRSALGWGSDVIGSYALRVGTSKPPPVPAWSFARAGLHTNDFGSYPIPPWRENRPPSGVADLRNDNAASDRSGAHLGHMSS